MKGLKNLDLQHLPAILADKVVMERFLSQLLGRSITLSENPELALPWDDIHCVPDIGAMDEKGCTYLVYTSPCGGVPLFQEMEWYSQHAGVKTGIHTIMFTEECPFSSRRSYYKIGPAFLNGTIAPVADGTVFHHLLTVSGTDVMPNAPEEIQQLLDLLGKRLINTPLSLLQSMAAVEYEWLWPDNLRRLKKECFAKHYAEECAEGRGEFAFQFSKECVRVYGQSYCESAIERRNKIVSNASKFVQITDDTLADVLMMPVELVAGLREGKQCDEDDYRDYYRRRMACLDS